MILNLLKALVFNSISQLIQAVVLDLCLLPLFNIPANLEGNSPVPSASLAVLLWCTLLVCLYIPTTIILHWGDFLRKISGLKGDSSSLPFFQVLGATSIPKEGVQV